VISDMRASVGRRTRATFPPVPARRPLVRSGS
jgi:hypothetical protein